MREMNMRPDPEDMRDWQYAEENPGFQREIAYTPDLDDPDRDLEIDEHVAAIYAHDNMGRRESNLRTENAQLRALLDEHGIEFSDGG